MKAAGLGGLWLATLIIALTGGWSVMYRISYVILLLIIVAWFWTYSAIKTLKVERRTRTQEAQVGGQFEEWIAVDNSSLLPKAWLEVRSRSDLAGHDVGHGIFLGPRARRSWVLRTECTLRGKFTVGDIVCTTGDPFGLFQRSRRFSSETTVLVYPRTVSFVSGVRIQGQLPGGARQAGIVPFVTPMASGVREYQPSDPYHRIHWPSTARTGRVMVKEFELDPFADVWIVLDLDGQAHRGVGPESTEEYAVTIAASLMQHFILEGRSVGLVGQGEFLPPDRGSRQVRKGLELLALARASRRQSLADTLALESIRFNRHATVCVVTPSTDEHWVFMCQELRQRGVQTMAVIIDGASFGAADSAPANQGVLAGSGPLNEITANLVAFGVGVHLVRRGQALEGLLAEPLQLEEPRSTPVAGNGHVA
jgi:uncharacterized protein (DUF58 family)